MGPAGLFRDEGTTAMSRKKDKKRQPDASSRSASGWLPVVIELPPFSQKWGWYGLTEADRTVMLEAILSNPEGWPVQRGTARARKARFSSRDLDRGKSGGYRVFYAVFRRYGKIVLVTLFPKSEQANLSKAGQNLVATLLREIRQRFGSDWSRGKGRDIQRENSSALTNKKAPDRVEATPDLPGAPAMSSQSPGR